MALWGNYIGFMDMKSESEENSSIIPALRKTFLFGKLDEDSIELVASIARIKLYGRGDMLFLEGGESTGFFILLSGRVKLYKSSSEGREQILHLIAPGESFAEAALFSGEKYPATAAAIVDSKVIFFARKGFLALLESDSKIYLSMVASLSKWLRKMTDLVAELSLKDVESRLAAYILELCRRGGVPVQNGVVVEIDVEKRELALYLGTVSETLSRTFKRMREAGLIEVEGKAVTITDAEKLSGLVHS
jgi:CRP/FNR family transcriptional regulator